MSHQSQPAGILPVTMNHGKTDWPTSYLVNELASLLTPCLNRALDFLLLQSLATQQPEHLCGQSKESPASPLIMQVALLSLLLMVALVSMPVECTTSLQDRETPSQHQWRRFNSHSEGSTTTAGFYMELRGSKRKGIHRHSLGKSTKHGKISQFI